MWQSHADSDDRNFVKPAPAKTQTIYIVSEPAVMLAARVIAAFATSSVGSADLETLLKRLLPNVLAPEPTTSAGVAGQNVSGQYVSL